VAQSKAKMAAHNKFGRDGELMAAEWLGRHGFELLVLNWRSGRLEIDIIASKNNVLHFVEVKSRHGDLFGLPEDWVGKKKMRHLLKAGVAYQEKYPLWEQVQYDILSILVDQDGKPDFFFIEDVYCW
jgi:putative endonuclease